MRRNVVCEMIESDWEADQEDQLHLNEAVPSCLLSAELVLSAAKRF